ncbi:MAG: hypothetical protein JOY73_11725 [Actinobacteria bacterium]|nr:hypothetical protein [Actinomycetota bacterium]
MPLRRSRRIRLFLGLVAAVLIGGALVAPVVLRGGNGPACTLGLTYKHVGYRARSVSGGVVQDVALGVGVTEGCGAAPMNVNLRTVSGVAWERAVAVTGDATALYVRRGVCASADSRSLLACLKR